MEREFLSQSFAKAVTITNRLTDPFEIALDCLNLNPALASLV